DPTMRTSTFSFMAELLVSVLRGRWLLGPCAVFGIRKGGCVSPNDMPQEPLRVLLPGLWRVGQFKRRVELARVTGPDKGSRDPMPMIQGRRIHIRIFEDVLDRALGLARLESSLERLQELGQMMAVLDSDPRLELLGQSLVEATFTGERRREFQKGGRWHREPP